MTRAHAIVGKCANAARGFLDCDQSETEIGISKQLNIKLRSISNRILNSQPHVRRTRPLFASQHCVDGAARAQNCRHQVVPHNQF